MECPCGGETKDHKIQKNYEIIGEYARCKGCGRVYWFWAGPEIDREKMPMAPPPIERIE
jgi:hypothetical protein